jgi:hypothetical protein
MVKNCKNNRWKNGRVMKTQYSKSIRACLTEMRIHCNNRPFYPTCATAGY